MAKVKGGESNKECVYLLNKLLGKPSAYVGSTLNKIKRFSAYKAGKTETYIERSITKNGWDAFQLIEIYVNASDEKQLRAWEKFYIGLFGTYKNDNPGFGMNVVRNPVLAISKDPIVAKKISEAAKNRIVSEESKLKRSNSMKGRVNVGVKRPYLAERNKIVKPALGRTGEKHPMSKKILHIPSNQTFDSIKEAGDYFGISRPGMRYRIEQNQNIYRYL
jgi:predicted GIY-YIG superfamily endonuclease